MTSSNNRLLNGHPFAVILSSPVMLLAIPVWWNAFTSLLTTKTYVLVCFWKQRCCFWITLFYTLPLYSDMFWWRLIILRFAAYRHEFYRLQLQTCIQSRPPYNVLFLTLQTMKMFLFFWWSIHQYESPVALQIKMSDVWPCSCEQTQQWYLLIFAKQFYPRKNYIHGAGNPRGRLYYLVLRKLVTCDMFSLFFSTAVQV